jgi:hypothetical protein
MLGRCQALAPRNKAFKFKGKIFLQDASLVELTLSLFPWATYRATKGAAKLHVGLDADGYLPAFVDLTANSAADLYKERWQIELFFKWMKQNLKIKSFLGTSRNAVLTQLWIALCAYLVLAFLSFTSKIGASMQQVLRLLQINLFERREFLDLFRPPSETKQCQIMQLQLI